MFDSLFPSGGAIAAFGLVFVRTSALALTSPVLGFGTGFAGYRIALTVFLALLLYGVAGAPITNAEPIELAALGLREALIGIFRRPLLTIERDVKIEHRVERGHRPVAA